MKILILVNDLGYFLSHRLPIALAAQQVGHEVHVAYGEQSSADLHRLRELGLQLHFVHIKRGGTNPLIELVSMFKLFLLFRRLSVDLVHLVTIKPVLYGGVAARLAKVPAVVSAMAGLGFVFVRRTGVKVTLLQWVLKPLLRWALGHPNQTLIFQNEYDRDRVLRLSNVVDMQTRLIRGSGIDVLSCPNFPEPKGSLVVTMAARLLRDKGVTEFVQAAKLLRERQVDVKFWLIGEPDLANPGSVTMQDIAAWQAEGVVKIWGRRNDVLTLYSQSNIVTLPSYYGEGLPKCLIEAAACGRAIVTTDMPGCRDVIEPGVTGLLVPPRDAVALADAIEFLIKDAPTRLSLGRAARELAEREFGIEKVIEAHLQIYDQLLETTTS